MIERFNIGRENYFKDTKGRSIYYDYVTNTAYYIPEDQLTKFKLLYNRMAIAIIVFAVIFSFNLLNAPLSALFGLLCYVVLDVYMFKKVLPSFSHTQQFDITDALKKNDERIQKTFKKTLVVCVLYFILGILLVLNAYDQNYSMPIKTACWAALAIFTYLDIKELTPFIRKK